MRKRMINLVYNARQKKNIKYEIILLIPTDFPSLVFVLFGVNARQINQIDFVTALVAGRILASGPRALVSHALARTLAGHALQGRDMVFNGIRLSCAGGRAIT